LTKRYVSHHQHLELSQQRCASVSIMWLEKSHLLRVGTIIIVRRYS